MTPKRAEGETIAVTLALFTDVALDANRVAAMEDGELFGWLNDMGYQWTGFEWLQTDRGAVI